MASFGDFAGQYRAEARAIPEQYNAMLRLRAALEEQALQKPLIEAQTRTAQFNADMAPQLAMANMRKMQADEARGNDELALKRQELAQKAPTEAWSEPYEANGALVQRNKLTGEVRQAVARAPERATPAPSVKDIVDPTDNTKMISVDTRVYRGGGMGSPGVIGMAGREPTSAKREEKASEGRDLLTKELDNIREDFKVLNESTAIPSSERSGIENAVSWVQSSTPGQIVGRVLGTKEQDARNRIQSARLRVMNAVKNATGMSAQQMNSNVELQTWLKSLGDVSNSYESNMGILDAIEGAYSNKSGKSPKPSGTGGVKFLGFEP